MNSKNTETELSTEKSNRNWQPIFTWLLVVNAIYILAFYLIMKTFG